MKRPILILAIALVILVAALVVAHLLRSPSQKGGAPKSAAPVPLPGKPLSAEAKQAQDTAAALTEKGYDFKQAGQNREALAAFEEAGGVLLPHRSELREAVASNLDDQATVYLRTGSFDQARKLYGEAMALLKAEGKEGDRLGQSVGRRLATLNALETHGIVCSEPMSPAMGAQDAGGLHDASPPTEAAIPYFPELHDMYAGFAKLQGDLRGCVDASLLFSPISVWMVVTGDGQVVLSSAKHGIKGTPTGNCLEEKLEKVASKHRNDLPRFRACFRSFTYPFLFGK